MIRPTRDWHAPARELRAAGATYRAIAAEVGVSYYSVWRLFNRPPDPPPYRAPYELSADGSTAVVELRGGSAIIDADDLDAVIGHRWRRHNAGYATCSIGQTSALMHRMLLGLEPGDKRVADHINGDRLDNRRSNLRIVTLEENAHNVRDRARGPRGVQWVEAEQRWRARVIVRGQDTSRRFEREADALAWVAEARAALLSGSREAWEAAC